MAENNILITEPQQLNDIRIWPLPFFRPDTTVRIVSRDVSPDQKNAWEKQLNQHVIDCGCELAGMGVIMGVVAYLLWIIFGPTKLAALNLTHLWQGLAVAIIGLSFGKIWGLIRARMRLSEVVQNIQERWNQDSDSSSDVLPSPVIEK